MKPYQFCLIVVAVSVWSATGCQQSADDTASSPSADSSHADHAHDDHSHDDHSHADDSHDSESGHDHHGEGPHQGHLVELGNGKFHAELVHDDSSVTIYLLDESTKSAVAIDATEILINLRHDGQAEQFKLPAAPDTVDPSGKSSRFTLQNADLAGHVDDEKSEAKISVMIEGTAYTGSLAHSH